MAENWKLIHRVAWYKWALIDLYENIIGIVMCCVFLGGVGYEVAHFFGYARTNQKWYWDIAILIFCAFLAYAAGRAVITSALDLTMPARNFEGQLDEITREHIGGSQGGFHVWQLKCGDQIWQIETASLPDLPDKVKPGQSIRVRFRRGTRWVTHLWIG